MSGPSTLLPFQPATMSRAQLAAVSFLARYPGRTHSLYAFQLHIGARKPVAMRHRVRGMDPHPHADPNSFRPDLIRQLALGLQARMNGIHRIIENHEEAVAFGAHLLAPARPPGTPKNLAM
jgi:hypothetical protein